MIFGSRLFKNFALSILGRGLPTFIINALILGKNYGQYKSSQKWTCIDYDNMPIPWYTYPAIEYLNNIKLQDLNILEYGSGNSSLYFINRGAFVTSIEDDYDWFSKIKKENMDRHNYIFCRSAKEYVTRNEITNADIVVIDGSHRSDCAKYVVYETKNMLIKPAMIIFDNADWYPNTIKNIDTELSWHRIDFCGFGPINHYTWVTSIYLNPARVLPRIDKHIESIGGTYGKFD